MGRLEHIRAHATFKDMLQGQLLHLGLIVLMIYGASSLLKPTESGGSFLGWDGQIWALWSISLAIIHQVIVAFVFRLELYKGAITHLFKDRAMEIWAAVFLPLLLARPATIFIAGWLDTNAITSFRGLEILIGLPLVVVAIATMHSVVKHFTIYRALGADHFANDVISKPLVRRGMFKFTDNGMYGLVFLGLWGIALLMGSWNALIVAFFQHTYIWVHMYLTEQPDMNRIYGSNG